MNRLRTFLFAWITVTTPGLDVLATEMPNILWITSEDNATQWLGCYGNELANTPHLDALAKESILFTHAYSNAPVCAVARATILKGCYAVSMGTQHMRSRYPVPQQLKSHVDYLRSLGYYCTNASKTDYNIAGNDRSIWDACGGNAHYKNRQEGQPFFAIFNLTICHESSLFPQVVERNRGRGDIPLKPRIDPDDIVVPPYLPDLPEVREDFAIYHDNISALDRRVGKLLQELSTSGVADDTIIFYYADHGGPTPRGKRYLTDTGVRIPMIIHIPTKWQHLSPFPPGTQTDEIVAFVDLTPTLLSLGGLAPPTHMQGRAFLGEHRQDPPENQQAFLFGDRFDEIIGMRRGVTDRRFKYIRRFTPHLPAAPYSYYLFSMPSWTAWQQAWQDKRLPPRFAALWESPQPTEALFDTQNDPWEVDNLAGKPEYADILERMRDQLQEKMLTTRDTGLIPESLFETVRGDSTLYEFAQSNSYRPDELLRLAWFATDGNRENLDMLISALADRDSVKRYWGAIGCQILATTGHQEEVEKKAHAALIPLLDDPEPTIRIVAALALNASGDRLRSKQTLLEELQSKLDNSESILIMNAIHQSDMDDHIPTEWLERAIHDPKTDKYVIRFAKRILQRRTASSP